MMIMKSVAGLCIVAAIILLQNQARADDVPVKSAKAIIADNKDAIVRVLAVVKKSDGGGIMAMFGGKESKVNVCGTVVDPSGLTVVSSGAFKPMAMVAVKVNGGDGDVEGGAKAPKTDITDVRIQMTDGTEFPARIVLEDPDLGLMFIMPEKKEGKALPKFSCSSDKSTAKPELLDPVMVLGRLGESLDHQPIVSFARISAVVHKPRTFYSLDPVSLGLDRLVFAADKKVVGLCVLLPRSGGADGMHVEMNLVVVPMQDVMELALQALKKAESKEAKPVAK